MRLDPYLTPLTKINSKRIKNLNIRSDTKNLTWKKLLDIGLGNDSFYMTPKAQATKAKFNKWDYIKLKSFCPAKKPYNKKAIYRMEENICKSYMR